MSTYAIGDLQGCFTSLQALLDKLEFDPKRDRLWFVGDLVNRGPNSLECLRFVRALGDSAVTVLGNHDLHLLAVAEGLAKPGKHDTLAPILAANDCSALLDWLRRRPLLRMEGGYALVHAGLLPEWDWPEARNLAAEVSEQLAGNDYRAFLGDMYGNEPNRWTHGLTGRNRDRLIVNAMTRMRILDPTGAMDMSFKGAPANIPTGSVAWFDAPTDRSGNITIIAGHWSALGVRITSGFVGLDSGCVWGRELSAFRLEDRVLFQVPCAESTVPLGWD